MSNMITKKKNLKNKLDMIPKQNHEYAYIFYQLSNAFGIKMIFNF